jgi:hypothetical protein
MLKNETEDCENDIAMFWNVLVKLNLLLAKLGHESEAFANESEAFRNESEDLSQATQTLLTQIFDLLTEKHKKRAQMGSLNYSNKPLLW